MTDYIELVKLNNNKILATKYATFVESPRDWDNFGTMLCFDHRHYTLGDKQTKNADDVQSIINSKKHISLPIRIYDHGGITISTDVKSYPYNDYWDSAFLGIIYVSLEDVRKNFKIKKVTKQFRDKAIEIMKAEVKLYSSYLEGEVYDYDIYTYKGAADFEELDVDDDEMKNQIQYDNDFEQVKDGYTEYFGDYPNFLKEAIAEAESFEPFPDFIREVIKAQDAELLELCSK